MKQKGTGQKEEDYYDLSICAVIISIIGARAYYVIFSWDMYKDDLLSIFNLRQGGLAILRRCDRSGSYSNCILQK